MPPGPLPPWRHRAQPLPKTHRGTRNKVKVDEVRAFQEARRCKKREEATSADEKALAGDVEHRVSPETLSGSATQVAADKPSSATQVARAQSATHVAMQTVTEQAPSSKPSRGDDYGLVITDQLIKLESQRPADRDSAIRFMEVFGVPLLATSDSEDE